MRTIADIGEHAVIDHVQKRLLPGRPPASIVVGIGDDAALLTPDRGMLSVVTTDAMVEGVHFDRGFCPMRAIGHKALAVNLSDLAAMGAEPRYALLSLALPPTLPVSDLDDFLGGFSTLAKRHATTIIGGNVTRSPGPLFVDVTAIGSLKRRRALTRSGARPGDILYVSGLVGAAAVGLAMLRPSSEDEGAVGGPAGHGTAEEIASDEVRDPCIDGFLFPEPRIRLGRQLAHHRAAGACIDLSDGLADGVRQLAAASGVGVVVDAAAIPVAPGATEWFQNHHLDPVQGALVGGEDYELLFAASPRARRKVDAARRFSGKPLLTPIGYFTKDTACVLRREATEEPLPAGYEHFRGHRA